MKDNLVKARTEHANLQCSVNYLVLNVRDASVGHGGALSAVVESSNR